VQIITYQSLLAQSTSFSPTSFSLSGVFSQTDTSNCAEDTCLIDVAKVSGEDGIDSTYERPSWFADIPFGQLPNNLHCQNPPCSEQVHLQLGGPNEMVVSFVSSVGSPTRSRVIYSEQLDQGCNRTKLLQNATGTTQQYSHLMYFSRHLVEPGMGKPTLTLEELAKIRSTEWCQDASTGWKYPCYHSFTAEDASRLYGGGRYYNFRDNYDSPNIHTVVLKGLAPNQSYCYSVDNDERVFSFKMPADRVLFPFKLGLRPGSVQSCSSFFRASLKNPMRPCVPHQRSQVIIAPHVFLQPRSDSLAFRPQQQSTSNSGSQKW